MADQVATFGLDDREFRTGLKRLEGLNRESNGRMEREWMGGGHGAGAVGSHLFKAFGAMAAGHHVVRLGIESLTEYAKVSDQAAAAQKRLGEAFTEMKVSIGRDLFGLMGDDLADVVRQLNAARETAVDWLADHNFGGDDRGALAANVREQGLAMIEGRAPRNGAGESGAEKRAAGKRDEAMQKELAGAREKMRMEREHKAFMLRASGDEFEARRVEERLRFQDGKDKDTGRHEERMAAIDEEERRAQEAIEQRWSLEFEKAAEAQRRSREESERQVRAGLDLLGDNRALAAIEESRLRGADTEAELLRLRFDLVRKIREVERESGLTAEQRADEVDRLLDSERDLEELTIADSRKKGGRGRGHPLEAGLSGAVNLGQILGGGGRDAALVEHRKTNTRLDDIAQTLELIERKTGVGTARYA